MKLHFGPRHERPAPRNRLVIQEREYNTLADAKRALTQLRRYWLKRVGTSFNCFVNGTSPSGVPRVYFARRFTDAELTRAGFDPQIFYEKKVRS